MSIAEMLTGGDPRSLGNTSQVVTLLFTDPTRLPELFECAFHPDAIVRMRAGDALEKVCRQHPKWLAPLKSRLLGELSQSTQPSLQWHLAQILSELALTPTEQQQAVAILLQNLETSDDWIVTNLTLVSLATFVRRNAFDRQRFVSILTRLLESPHRSVVSRVRRLLKEFEHE